MRSSGVAMVVGMVAIGSVFLPGLARSGESDGEGTAEEKPAVAPSASASASAPKEEVRGPAQDLVLEVSLGYAGGVFTAIEGHDPTVTNGPMFHLGVGYAWTLKHNQSVGVAAIADGTLDTDRSTKMGGHVAGRYGGAAFVYGERAHLRLLFGYAHAALDGATYGGIGVGFGAGWHVPLGQRGNWKRVAFIAEIAPSWDFLGAGSQTLHRWNFGLLFGIAVI
jgi:hypothetical protein